MNSKSIYDALRAEKNAGKVSVPHRTEPTIPPHLSTAFRQLKNNLDSLENLFRHISTCTQTEIYLSSMKGNTLFDQQRNILSDIVKCSEAEIKFLTAKLLDSNSKEQDIFATPQQKSTLIGWQTIYGMLSVTAVNCHAEQAALFVLDATSSSSGLRLASFVSTDKLTPLADGSLQVDILEIAEAVVRTKCSVNARAPVVQRATQISLPHQQAKSGYQTIFCCPVFRESVVIGALTLLNHRPLNPTAPVRLFTVEDEARAVHCAENVSQMFTFFQLLEKPAFLSPTNWENTWIIATHGESVLGNFSNEITSKSFVYRDDGSAPTTSAKQVELQTSKQRAAIPPTVHLKDLLTDRNEAVRRISALEEALLQRDIRIQQLESSLVDTKYVAETACKGAETMRMANERLLRQSFVPEGYHDSDPAIDSYQIPIPVKLPSAFKKPSSSVGPKSARRRHYLS